MNVSKAAARKIERKVAKGKRRGVTVIISDYDPGGPRFESRYSTSTTLRLAIQYPRQFWQNDP